MKKLTDEDIQKMVEQQQFGNPDADKEELRSYQLLFEALRAEPEGGLPMNFASRVARQAWVKAEQRQRWRFWLLQFVTIGLALPLSILLLFIYQPQTTQNFISYIFEFRWIILFCLSMFALIQIADYNLLRDKRKVIST